MDKTPLYYIEKFASKLLGLLVGVYFFFNPVEKFISEDIFFDKALSFSSTLFGFLLAVLTLIIQSNSKTIEKMKSNKSYSRLIRYNKNVVYMSGLLSLLSLIFISTNDIYSDSHHKIYTIFCSLNVSLLAVLVIDAIIFLIIFYSIILKDAND